LFLPTDWNGSVVFYAHGARQVWEPVNLPTIGDSTTWVRDALGAAGFAFAYSSWSENGAAVADAIRRQHQLRGLFISRFGQPEHSYLMAHSLGSLASVALAEKFPKQYDGAFLMCGLLAGTDFAVEHLGTVRLLFDFFYPGVLPGRVDSMPPITPGSLITDVVNPALAAIQANPVPLFTMLQIDQVLITGFNATELVNSTVRALAGHAGLLNDVLGRSHGHFPFSNAGTVYTIGGSSLPLTTLNATIPRFSATPDALAWLQQSYEPTGRIGFPVLTMHNNRGDYLAPLANEDIFEQKVDASGASDLLVRREVNAWGHCVFTVQQMVDGLLDLADWVEHGNKP
jgi:pimeloyl-ACP methyl ester carboxylesterase